MMEEAYMRRDVKAASDVGGAPGNSGRVAGLMKSHAPKKVSQAMLISTTAEAKLGMMWATEKAGMKAERMALCSKL
jgi:hypothetical protein